MILNKVSFNAWLFERELVKALNTLSGIEKKEFITWCQFTFSKTERSILLKYVKLD